MKHTVEIADSQGRTMQISVYVENIGFGGSWRALDKGMIRHNSGSVVQYTGSWDPDVGVELMAGGAAGIDLEKFISWGTVNDEGTGTVEQAWVIGLTPGEIEWSVV